MLYLNNDMNSREKYITVNIDNIGVGGLDSLIEANYPNFEIFQCGQSYLFKLGRGVNFAIFKASDYCIGEGIKFIYPRHE